MPRTNDKTCCVAMPEQLWNDLSEWAREEDRSTGNLIRRILSSALTEREGN